MKKPAESVHINLFSVRFKSDSIDDKDSKLLTETVQSIDYQQLNNTFDIQSENLYIDFNNCIVNNKIQPHTILEKLKKTKAVIVVELSIHDKARKVVRKVTFSQCEIESIKGLQSFVASKSEPAKPSNVGFSYKKLKIV